MFDKPSGRTNATYHSITVEGVGVGDSCTEEIKKRNIYHSMNSLNYIKPTYCQEVPNTQVRQLCGYLSHPGNLYIVIGTIIIMIMLKQLGGRSR